jgi:hypothetical protein
LNDALSAGSLVFNNPNDRVNFEKIYNGEPINGHTVSLSSELLSLLASLLAGGPLALMNLYRFPHGGPHGRLINNGNVLCDAVDIASYRGIKVHLTPPSSAIQVVSQIISNIPSGRFDIGYPRPMGGPTGFNPAQDVFFSVPDVETAYLCFHGHIARTLGQMLQPAQNAIRAAQAAIHATIATQYPDGLDHLHINVTRP